jgi:hypothetical protein
MTSREELFERIKLESQTIIRHSIGSIDPEENAKAIALSDERVLAFLVDRRLEHLNILSFRALSRQSPNLLDYDLVIDFAKGQDVNDFVGLRPIEATAHIVVEIPTRSVKAVRFPVPTVLPSSSNTPLALIAAQSPLRSLGSVSVPGAEMGVTTVPEGVLNLRRERREKMQHILKTRFGLTETEIAEFAAATASGTDSMTNTNSVQQKTGITGSQTAVGSNSESGFPPQLDDSTTDYQADGTTDVTNDTIIDIQTDDVEA